MGKNLPAWSDVHGISRLIALTVAGILLRCRCISIAGGELVFSGHILG